MEFLCTTEQFLVHPSFESPGSDFVFLSAVGNSRYVITTHPRSSFTLLKLIILQEYSLIFKPSYCPDFDDFSGGAWKGLGMRLVNTRGAHCVGASPLSLVPGACVGASPLSLVPGARVGASPLSLVPGTRVGASPLSIVPGTHCVGASPLSLVPGARVGASPLSLVPGAHCVGASPLSLIPARMWVHHHSAANFFCARAKPQ